MIGQTLGHYRIVEKLGEGGMGVVYRARDEHLNRDVAIKVLPETFARDPERLARFEREAQLLASLNHSNIAAIYGLEERDGLRFLVMELVPGKTLAELVGAGLKPARLPVEEALEVGKQIAEALEAAHEKGIVHRDLKPANVKVTPEGKVKVLDFGLAKALEGESPGVDLSQSPTVSAGTRAGVILGTAAYMSPEQARGRPVDKRADIWAFGCVLYEVLTGRQPFRGETATDTIAAIVRSEPDWQALPPETPSRVCELIRRCLRKDSHARWQDAGDVRLEIEETLDEISKGIAPRPEVASAARGLSRSQLQWALLGVMVGALGAGVAVWKLKPAPAASVRRFVVSLPAGQQLARLTQPVVALSPDGKYIVYAAGQAGIQQLYLRSLDNFEAKPIAGTEGANAPFFSPDSQSIGFFAEGKLKKIPVSGGSPVSLCSAGGTVAGASWGTDETIVFHHAMIGGLSHVSAGGGQPQALNTQKGEQSDRWPAFLPGAKFVLFTAAPLAAIWGDAHVRLHALKTGEQRDLIQGGTHPHYAPTGHLLYMQAGTLIAVPFDLRRLEVTGAAVPMVEGVMQSTFTGVAQYSLSDNGSLAYVPGDVQSGRQTLVWVDRKGVEQPLAAPASAYSFPRLSPDGRRVALPTSTGDQSWIYDLTRETSTRLEGGTFGAATWTPDGKRVVYQSGSPRNLFWQPADGSGRPERLTTGEYAQGANSWTPDGQVLAFVQADPSTGFDLWVLRISDRKPQPFLRTPANETAPAFSPDGRWLAYSSDESGRWEIYVRPYPGPGGKWLISTEGGMEPVWNRNGRELFYRNGNKMMAIEITTQPGFSAGKPKVLFEGPYVATPVTFPNYDVSPDGRRFLMLKASGQEQAATQINVVLNWFEELKRRVPAGAK